MQKAKKKKRPGAVKLRFFLFLTIALVVFSLIAPLFAPHDPNATNPQALNLAPCAEYPLGCDLYGRCVLSRILAGAGTSVFSAVALVALTFVIGTFAGMISGWYGGIADTLIMRIAEIFLAFPQMVLAIAVAGILGGGMGNAMLALGVTGWTLYARLARAQVMTLKEEPFVQAARLSGFGAFRIMFRTLLPNMAGPLIVNAATQLGTMMISLAGLSFLGIGVQEPKAEWGSMVAASRAYMQLAPWAVLAPAFAILITVMIFNYLGDCFRDYLDVEAEHE